MQRKFGMRPVSGYFNWAHFNFLQKGGDICLRKKHSLTFPAREDTCRGHRGTNHRGENNYDGSVPSGLIFTSNRISRLFLSGSAKGGIEKMRSIFFQKIKSSGVPVIPPGGGTGPEAKATQQQGCVQYKKV